MGDFNIATDWLSEGITDPAATMCYIFAVLVFVFGMGAVGWKAITDSHNTGRDISHLAGYVLLITGMLVAAGAFVPDLIG